uniref:Caveolin n=1 Tax=Spermophilus dauricus TaxID=99837 RepID=A0A8C9PYC6_SPEDA
MGVILFLLLLQIEGYLEITYNKILETEIAKEYNDDSFEDVIAEPVTTHSFDKVWICSHALFEISKYVIYKFLTVFLAIPLAFAAGILFATLSCLHIWIIMPFVKTCLMVLPSVQTIWKSVTDVIIAPLYTSIGRCFSSVNLQLSKD